MVLTPRLDQKGEAHQQAHEDGEQRTLYPESASGEHIGPAQSGLEEAPDLAAREMRPKTPACMKFHPKWMPIASQSLRVRTYAAPSSRPASIPP